MVSPTDPEEKKTRSDNENKKEVLQTENSTARTISFCFLVSPN